MADPKSVQFMKDKMAEKGIKPQIDKKLQELMPQEKITEQILIHRLNKQERDLDDIITRFNEVIKFLSMLDVKMSDVLNEIRRK